MDRAKLIDLVEASDSDGLIRFIDGLCAAREWEGLVETRERCRQAETRGKQLFGVAQFADYRLALEAPGELAGTVLVDGAGRFALGPLWEVAASTHSWKELDPYLSSVRMRALIAAERALRGEDVTAADIDDEVLGVPHMVRSWEPSYPVATYRSDGADFPGPDPIPLAPMQPVDPGDPLDDIDSEEALYALGRTWAEESNGSARVASVHGDAAAAIAAIADGEAVWGAVSFDVALAHMAWAGASGGAHGARRGSAVGRSDAWAATAALGDIEWVPDADEVRDFGQQARWYLWAPAGHTGGWALGLAAEHGVHSYAWAVWAEDAADENETAAGR